MRVEEIKAKTYVKLVSLGFTAKLNHRVNLKTQFRGYKQVNVDIAIMDWEGKFTYCFYIGSIKARKMTKYKMLKIPIGVIREDSEISPKISAFVDWASSHLYG